LYSYLSYYLSPVSTRWLCPPLVSKNYGPLKEVARVISTKNSNNLEELISYSA
jgi:hypothetical protein